MICRFVPIFALATTMLVACTESPKPAPADAGVPMMRDDAQSSPDLGDPIDTGVFADADGFGDADGFVDAEMDAGFEPDADPVDVGPSGETRCRATFSQVEEYENVATILPATKRNVWRSWMSSDYKRLYVTVEMPSDVTGATYQDDLFVLTRTATSGPFQQATRTNLDVASNAANESHERDLTYVPSIDRYWYVEGEGFGGEVAITYTLMSVRLSSPSSPETFVDFQTEHLNLAETEQSDDIRSPALTPDGLLMIASKRIYPSKRMDLYEFRRSNATDAFDEGQALDTVTSTSSWDVNPWISHDGLQLVFRSGRLGDNDIFCAWRNSIGEAFQGPILFGGRDVSLDTAHEYAPFMLDGNLYFVRAPANGLTRLYRAVP